MPQLRPQRRVDIIPDSMPSQVNRQFVLSMPEEDYLTSMHLPKTSRFRSYEEFEQDIDIRASRKIDQILHRSKVLDADEQRALTRRRVSQHAAIPPRPRDHRIRTSYETSSSFKGQYEVRSSTDTE